MSDADDDPRLPAFEAFLITQRKGELMAELSEQLTTLTCAVRDVNRAGSITLTIKIKPDESGRNTFLVTDDVKVKIPQFARGVSLFFATVAGRLVRENPTQRALPFTTTERGARHE